MYGEGRSPLMIVISSVARNMHPADIGKTAEQIWQDLKEAARE